MAQLQKVRVSYSAPSTSIAFQVAKAEGFYKDEGLDVDLIHINPRLAPVALTNGEIDFTTTFNYTLQGIIQGLPLRFVFVSVRKGVYFLIARPEIKSAQALVNKRIDVTNLTSLDHVTSAEMLRTKGVNPAGVTFLGLGNEGLRIQAPRAGVVDATAIAPPHHFSLTNLGFQTLAGPRDVQRVRPSSGIAVCESISERKTAGDQADDAGLSRRTALSSKAGKEIPRSWRSGSISPWNRRPAPTIYWC
jgi:ABC-type nitrate/sulfonate/bicarbonate transport system substrate-binding protein